MVCIYNSIFFVFFTGHHFDHIEQCWPLQEMDNLIRWNRAAYVQGSLLTGGAYSSSEFVLQGLTSTVNVCLEWNSCRDYVRSWDASSVVWFIGDVCRWFQALIVLIVTVVNVVPFRFTMVGPWIKCLQHQFEKRVWYVGKCNQAIHLSLMQVSLSAVGGWSLWTVGIDGVYTISLFLSSSQVIILTTDHCRRWITWYVETAAYVQGSLLTGSVYSSSELVLQGLTSTVNVCLEWNSHCVTCLVKSGDASMVYWWLR